MTGMGIGLFPSDLDGINQYIRCAEHCEPNPKNTALYDDLFKIYQKSDLAMHAISHSLVDFEKKYPRIKQRRIIGECD